MQSEIHNIIIFCILVTFLVIGLVAFLLIFIATTQKKQFSFQLSLDSLKESFESKLMSYQLQIEENVFNKISQEIHDNINQTLTLAKLELTSVDSKEFGRNREKIYSSIHFLTEAINELRSLSHVLNKEYIRSIGLKYSIEKEIKKIQEVREFEIIYEFKGEPDFSDPETEVVLFRIFQELMQNVIKHADSRKVNINLNAQTENFKMTVKDYGKGFKVDEIQHSDGFGLRSIVHRVHEMKGVIDIKSCPDEGAIISLSIPQI